MDGAETALRIRAFLWSVPGAVLGLVAGFAAGHPLLGAAVGGAVVFGAVTALVGLSGRAAGALHAPSGRTTPRAPEHSLADSLVVRGRFEEAVSVLEVTVAEDPSDAVPYLRLARIHRDHLRRYDEAARWFGRACRDARIEPGQEMLALRELAEMHLHASGRPERAAPALARLADRRANTPEGRWAAGELAALKDRLQGGPANAWAETGPAAAASVDSEDPGGSGRSDASSEPDESGRSVGPDGPSEPDE